MAFAFANGIMQSIAGTFYDSKVDVYLLFKQIGKKNYVPSVRISHWQVICHFKNDNRYICYELQTDNGDKGGIINYQISTFSYDGIIYYYYVGECGASEGGLKEKCEKIEINNSVYKLVVNDCQTWALLLIESLGLCLIDPRQLLLNFVMGSSKPPGDVKAALECLLNQLILGVQLCNGYKNLLPVRLKI